MRLGVEKKATSFLLFGSVGLPRVGKTKIGLDEEIAGRGRGARVLPSGCSRVS